MYAAIDLVSEKLETQFRKYKGKIQDRHSGKMAQPPAAPLEIPLEPEVEERAIVKTKLLELKPMTDEEAILQMELLGHDFFVFTSAETETINVLYRRRDGDYGLIAPRASR
jgi:putative sigma-54 modulation protein